MNALFTTALLALATAALQPNPEAIFHTPPKPLAPGAVTSDWPSFLGPTHNMVSAETKLLKEFPVGGPRLVWEMKKGDSYGAPAVVGERLVLFHRVGNEAVVDCLNALDGRRYWRFCYPTEYRDRYGYNQGPRCSPVIAGDAVFTFGADGQLHCLELESGRVRWQRDLVKEFKLKQNFFGVGATPLVEGDKLIVNVGAPDGPCVAAFDTRTGRMLWGAPHPWGPSYATPVAATVEGRRRLFVFAGGESDPPSGGLLVLEPDEGKILGSFPWRGRRFESVNASTPVVIGNQVFISECYGAGGALVTVKADGRCEAAWTSPRFGTHFMTSVVKDGHLYGVDGYGSGQAALVCVEVNSGRELWRAKPRWEEVIKGREGAQTVSFATARGWLLLVDGRCLCLGEFGHLLWLDLNPQGYRELARTRLFTARDTWTPPVLSRGLLYVCQNSRDPFQETPPRLLCYDLRGD